MIVNDFVWMRPLGDPLGHDEDPRAWFPLDFMLGGFGKILELPGPPPAKSCVSFIGYIDEVRISREARYDVDKKGFMPDDKFKNDAKTAALWHFDEPSGTREFSDASGNAYHLEGKNGAQGPASHLQSKQKKNSPSHGDDLNNEAILVCVKEICILPRLRAFILPWG